MNSLGVQVFLVVFTGQPTTNCVESDLLSMIVEAQRAQRQLVSTGWLKATVNVAQRNSVDGRYLEVLQRTRLALYWAGENARWQYDSEFTSIDPGMGKQFNSNTTVRETVLLNPPEVSVHSHGSKYLSIKPSNQWWPNDDIALRPHDLWFKWNGHPIESHLRPEMLRNRPEDIEKCEVLRDGSNVTLRKIRTKEAGGGSITFVASLANGGNLTRIENKGGWAFVGSPGEPGKPTKVEAPNENVVFEWLPLDNGKHFLRAYHFVSKWRRSQPRTAEGSRTMDFIVDEYGDTLPIGMNFTIDWSEIAEGTTVHDEIRQRRYSKHSAGHTNPAEDRQLKLSALSELMRSRGFAKPPDE